MTGQEFLNNAVTYLSRKVNNDKLSEMSIQEFILFVTECQQEMVQACQLPLARVHQLDEARVAQFLKIVQEEQGGQFIFRHGEQDFKQDDPRMTLSEKRRKIEMMRSRHNKADPITLSSAIDFIGTLLIMVYLKGKTGYTVQAESSSNYRAAQPMQALAKCLGCSFALLEKWDCINYLDEEFDYNKLDEKGNVKWVKGDVNAVVGADVFDPINAAMLVVKEAPIHQKEIVVAMTHTQQLDALYESTYGLSSSSSAEKLGYFGFVFINKEKFFRCVDGFYSKVTIDLDYKSSEVHHRCLL